MTSVLAGLLPYLTGAGGALAALVIGIVLIQAGKLVPDRYHQQVLTEAAKLREANDTLRETLRMAQEQNMQLSSSTQITIQLMNVLEKIAGDRLPPQVSDDE